MRGKIIAAVKRDFVDRGAKTWKSQRKTIDIATVVLPAAAGAITTFSNVIERLGLGLPGGLLLPVYLLVASAACAWLIQAKSRASKEQRYRFPQELRKTAKLFLPAFILMFAITASDLRPNIWRSEHAIAGFICSADQKPISRAMVIALDKFGRPSSKDPETTDDEGYFFLDLDMLALPPKELRVSSSRCASMNLSVTSASLSVRGCSSNNRRTQSQERMWVHSCLDRLR